MLRTTSRLTICLVASLACATLLSGQQATAISPAALRHEIELADSTIFAAYNAHDADQIGRYFASDIEFYHDTGGLMTLAQVMAGLSSTFTKSPDIRRTLVGAIDVYPVPHYGAIEVGVHQFCHREDGRQECGTFKFTHVWRRTPTGWQISRIVSYGH